MMRVEVTAPDAERAKRGGAASEVWADLGPECGSQAPPAYARQCREAPLLASWCFAGAIVFVLFSTPLSGVASGPVAVEVLPPRFSQVVVVQERLHPRPLVLPVALLVLLQTAMIYLRSGLVPAALASASPTLLAAPSAVHQDQSVLESMASESMAGKTAALVQIGSVSAQTGALPVVTPHSASQTVAAAVVAGVPPPSQNPAGSGLVVRTSCQRMGATWCSR
ncbi:hypothetical protein C0992_000546, partial [Termitomyces sp. T32_za158]